MSFLKGEKLNKFYSKKFPNFSLKHIVDQMPGVFNHFNLLKKESFT